MRFNPFSNVTGPRGARLAPTLRTTYVEKVKNCFYVLEGVDYAQAGIMDWLTGMSKLVLDRLANQLSRFIYTRRCPFLLKQPISFIATMFDMIEVSIALVTFVISVCLTMVAALTIIPVIHAISFLLTMSDRHTLLSIMDKEGKTVEAFLKEEEKEWTDLHFNYDSGTLNIEPAGRLSDVVDFHPVFKTDQERKSCDLLGALPHGTVRRSAMI